MSVERRCATRFAISFPLSLMLGPKDSAVEFNLECLNFSLKGLEVESNSLLVQELQKQDSYPQVCVLDFELPGESYHFTVSAQVATYRRLSLHQYRIGLIFTDMSERALEVMERYQRQYRLGDYEYRSLIQAGTRPDIQASS